MTKLGITAPPGRWLVGAVGVLLVALTAAACAGGGQPQPLPTGPTNAASGPVLDPVDVSTPTPSPPAGPVIDLAAIDPCELVTAAQAESILMLGVAEPQRHDTTETRSCTYTAPPTGPVGKVDIYVGQGAANILGFNRDLLSHEFTEVNEVGDEAYEKPFEFYFRTADMWVVIAVVRIVPAEEVEEQLRLAARTAASRLDLMRSD